MIYDVHMYHVMRAKFCAIEADSHEQAIEIIREADLSYANEHEDAEEVTGWLVDVVGDEQYENSRSYQCDGVTLDRLKYYYVRHDTDYGLNLDLLVHAYDQADAFKVWQEYYEDATDDVGFEDVSIERMVVPTDRGAMAWRN